MQPTWQMDPFLLKAGPGHHIMWKKGNVVDTLICIWFCMMANADWCSFKIINLKVIKMLLWVRHQLLQWILEWDIKMGRIFHVGEKFLFDKHFERSNNGIVRKASTVES